MRLNKLAAALAGLIVSTAAALAQDVANGESEFKKCRACHDIGKDAVNKVGPALSGLIGRTAGSVKEFSYSDANLDAAKKGLIWTEEVLLKYLEDPRAFMPGTKMAFAGIKDEADRKDLIAYMKAQPK